MILSSTRPITRWRLLSLSALPAIPLGQRLALNKHATRSGRSPEINQPRPREKSVPSLCCNGGEGLGPKGSGTSSHASAPVLKIRRSDLLRRESGVHSNDLRREQSVRSQLSPGCYTHHISACFTRPPPITPALLRLDPIWDPSQAIPLSKNSAKKSSRESAARGSNGKSSRTISAKPDGVGCYVSTVDSHGRIIWIADARR